MNKRPVHKIFSFLFLLTTLHSYSQSAKLKVWLDPISESIMHQYGVELDHGEVKKGVYVINDFTAQERQWLSEAGIRFDVLIDNLEDHYAQRAMLKIEAEADGSRSLCEGSDLETFDTPENFGLGSMGGFFTYQEFLNHLDKMHAKYPEIITQRIPIDTFTTVKGREIFWVRISDSASLNQNEPEALYTSIHHAREPQSLAQLIFYMWYLLENYGTDAEVTHLVKNTEMYFIPMINPDGYIFNETTNPDGGGLWRKNRRDNLDGEIGVDLNRNYEYQWAYDNSGSSPSTNSQTYRGISSASENETKAVQWFCENHEFEFCLNYHSHGNYLIYPWGYIPSPLSPDSNYFIEIAKMMTAQNNYVYGTGYETVNYATNGVSDDWMYGEQTTKNKIFSMTPEVGTSSDGFWPITSRIIPLSKENIRPNLLLAQFSGDYATMIDKSPPTLADPNGIITIELLRLGQHFNGPYEFRLEPTSTNIDITTPSISIQSMPINNPLSEEFEYEVDPNTPIGTELKMDMVAVFNGFEKRERITKIYGEPTIVLSHSAFNTKDFRTNDWSPTTEDFISAPSSITDSPFAQYSNNDVSEIEYERIIDLRQSITGYLTFSAQWQIEAGYDYCQLLAAPIGSKSWTPLCGLYTKEGTENQDEGQPVWDGNVLSWVNERIDLNDFIGQRIKLKLRLVSDPFVVFDGFYFDDLTFHSLIDESLEIPVDTGYIDSVVGVETIIISSDVALFPNPAKDQIQIRSSKAPSQVHLYNIQGQLIRTYVRNKSILDLSDLSPGYYFLRLEFDAQQISKPFIIAP